MFAPADEDNAAKQKSVPNAEMEVPKEIPGKVEIPNEIPTIVVKEQSADEILAKFLASVNEVAPAGDEAGNGDLPGVDLEMDEVDLGDGMWTLMKHYTRWHWGTHPCTDSHYFICCSLPYIILFY